MSECDVDMLCKLGLYDNLDIKRWISRNHPDKNPDNFDQKIFQNVTNCNKAKKTCNPKVNESFKTKNADPSYKFRSSRRARIYNCTRQSENWSKISPNHKLDNKLFNKADILQNIPFASPKLVQMFNIIKKLDENDLKTHGRLFKHYIFSDVKEGGYGAKIIASAFIANGFNMAVENSSESMGNGKTVKRLKLKKPSGINSFGILSSTPLWKSELSQKFKKQMLSVYNSRPQNINGKDMRFIILDSGFKEGIDLFDVKYVHIFENPVSLADTKQIIGRATRTCGQKGLDFEPNVGWPLFVYNYSLLIPDEIKGDYIANDPSLLNDGDDKMVLNHNTLSESAMLYSETDHSLANLTNQLYTLASAFSVDYVLTKNIHKSFDDFEYEYVDSNRNSPSANTKGGATSTVINCSASSKCGKRSTNDVPVTQQLMRQVYIKNGYNIKDIPEKHQREFFCRFMKTTPSYCSQLNETIATRASLVPSLVSTPPPNPLPIYSGPSANTPPPPVLGTQSLSSRYSTPPSFSYSNPPTPIGSVNTNGYMPIGPSSNNVNSPANNGYMSILPATNSIKSNSSSVVNSPASNGYMSITPSTNSIKSNSSPLYASNTNFTLSTPTQTPPSYIKPNSLSPSSRSDINRSIKTLEENEIPGLLKELSVESKKNKSSPVNNELISKIRNFRSDLATLRQQLEMSSPPSSPQSSPQSSPNSVTEMEREESRRFAKKMAELQKSRTPSQIIDSLDLVPYSPQIENAEVLEYTGNNEIALRMPEPGPPTKKLGFLKMRDFIQTNFAVKFTWPPIVVENRCGTVARQEGGANIMKLNPSQNFIKSFFTTNSPYKGILLWFSVGTGKTCTAIATASDTFERDGYTILWVTRNTLKGDVKKNIYDDVCHQVLVNKLTRGIIKSIPVDTAARNKLLGNNWIEPISFKTFSNLLSDDKHNEYMEILKKRNGTVDILNKTLIIIDEAHKLYGGDLKGSESPDMDIMEKMLQNSYIKSGKNSARLILMTATPITSSPMELFKLINMCVDKESEKIPTDIGSFKKQFLNDENRLSKPGIKKLADHLTGYISYLNRENDPTQFAQPVIIHVPAIMSNDYSDDRPLFYTANYKGVYETDEFKGLFAEEKRINDEINKVDNRFSEIKKNINGKLDTMLTHCKTLDTKKERDECIKTSKDSIKSELSAVTADNKINKERLKASLKDAQAKISKFQKGVKEGEKKEESDFFKNKVPNQEEAIFKRCKHIEKTGVRSFDKNKKMDADGSDTDDSDADYVQPTKKNRNAEGLRGFAAWKEERKKKEKAEKETRNKKEKAEKETRKKDKTMKKKP